MPTLIDTNCHLDFPELAADQNAVVERARQAGVKRMITISTHASKFDTIKGVAEKYDDVFCTAGVHPHHSGEPDENIQEQWLVDAAKHPKVVGLGETGLDYYYDNSPKDEQERNFRTHIRACITTGLPIIVHARDADADVAKMIKEDGQGKLTGLLHCFSSGRELAEKALEIGFYISFSGIVTFKKSDELRAIAKDIPLDRILVETDAPFLAPMPHRGKTNEPSFVVHTAACVAEVKGIPLEELGRITTENALRLFKKMSAPA
jgi:TatD DNase family protein